MEQMNQQMHIAFKVETDKEMSPVELSFEHTVHSFQRAQQRGIRSLQLETTLQYGYAIYKQGLIYYILGENNIPEKLSKIKGQIVNTVVIVSGDSNQIITCYRSARPFKHIKMKSKKLYKNIDYAA